VRLLLDTNVVSALRRATESAVREWAAAQDTADMAISVLTVMEIEIGIQRRQRSDPAQAAVLRRWFEERLLAAFARRILPIDLDVARHTAALHAPDPAPERDALIAGTALSRSMTVVTRNVADFERTGVSVVNPWENSAGRA
jgi:predicted nucleic acid-binding protein